MRIKETGFEGLLLLEPKTFEDERGHFMESYNYETLKKLGIDIVFVQDNQSFSTKGVIRGLHFQKPPYAQTKLVRVLSGRILDVVVDLRQEEETCGKSYSIELSSKNNLQLLVPKGFAHGFQVLSNEAEIIYKCDDFYRPSAEGGVKYNDSKLNIVWVGSESNHILSEKDLKLPEFKEVVNKLIW